MVRLIHYLRGYVSLVLSGQFIERFINICMHRGLFLWDVKKTAQDSARAKMSLHAFKQLRPIAKKTHTRVKIVEKHGLPLRLAAYKKRTFFILGLLLAISFLYVSSLFIWSVDIVGLQHTDEAELRSVLAELGVHRGALKYGQDPKALQNRALLKLDGISWLWVDIRGCRATVHILEKRPAPEILSTDPCDIVALREGVIIEVRATEGNKAVKAGDTVLKGQVLISSVMPSERIEARYTHAAGLVFARTWYEESMTVPLTKLQKAFTGKSYTERTLKLGKLTVPLSRRIPPMQANCERTQSTHTLVLFGIDTHIAYQSALYRPYTPKTVAVPAETAIQAAEVELDKRIASTLCDKNGERLQVHTTVHENGDGTLTVTRTAEYKEQIGTETAVNAL